MSRKRARAAKRERTARSLSHSANGCGKAADRPATSRSSLTPKRLRFAFLWAEADPDDRLQDVALRAGYSESFSVSGGVAELCRDPAIVEVRDRRLLELQAAAAVTVEDQLVGLRLIAEDRTVPAKDRVAARKAILAWLARDKGQSTGQGSGGPPPASTPASGRGLDREARADFELNLLGVALEDGEPA